MKLLLLSVRNSRRFLAVIICSLLLCCLAVQKSAACSWDYLIWINQNKKADPLYRFLKDGKAGYIDRNGKVVIQPRFKFYSNSGGEFHEGLMRIDEDGIDYVDATGKPVALKDIAWGFDFSEGLTPAKSEDENRWGFINRTGKFVISPRFEDIPGSEFSEGMAAVKADGRYGYIDHTGQFIIAPKFVFAADFQDGMARVILEGNCSYFEDGPCSFEPVNIPYTMTGRLAPCQFTFINKSGSLISATGFEAARDFSEGLAAVRVNHKWGFIDKQGRFVIKPQFEAAKQFSDGLARFKQGDLWGYINHRGEVVIEPQFKDADDFSDGLAVVSHWNEAEQRYDEDYYINKRGAQAIAEKFVYASHFFKGLAHVKLKTAAKICPHDEYQMEGAFAYIDVTGKKIFTYQNCQSGEDD